ncbi:MAG: DJ-1/PfpI family protein [Candidatus Eisenbacteria bacterium]|uniref:DJ-1/PfpI family protein n=1 Tax=Eiseniibacteriota bacterium TaxID=2212470 RepID=A0A948RU38_UNCEI|nr:DJ-1/PfpI family protein [Candidatus Eisenbacteria bacterium]MBU1950976.1 DJ-1/PfpI family protein [Candidatus Eisenbacteria bacterium]MBU2690915.1 DJ-1/PfpI family protein [Candidatus Eisenbacteria bacterium]
MTLRAKRVLVPMARGVEEIEAVAVIDILMRAGCHVVTASVGDTHITGSHGIRLGADRRLTEVLQESWDLVVIPGGMENVKILRADPDLRALLRERAAQHHDVAAICAGPLVLLDAGLLKDRRITCHAAVEEELGGVRIVQLPVVEDGSLITSRGPGTAVEFALRLVRRLAGPMVEEEVRRQIHA